MTATENHLRTARRERHWNQEELARRLGVSQTLISLWEHGTRRPPAKRIAQLRTLGVSLDPKLLPLHSAVAALDVAQELANLGYSGFAHLANAEPEFNPAQLLVLALSQDFLDRRTAEALPWLVLRYASLDWEWVRRECKVRDLQNRLGFTVAIAKKLALLQGEPETAEELDAQERSLRDSLLAKEDTYCNERMTISERRWLETNRPREAAAWHVLTDLAPEHVTHA